MRGSYGGNLAASHARTIAILLLLAPSACLEREEQPAAPAQASAEQLEELVPALVDAVQAKLPGFVLDHVAQGFKSDDGLDYFGVRAIVDEYAFRDDEVGARLESLTIAKQDDGRQRVHARVAFTPGQRLAVGAPLPPGGVTYAFDLVFALDGLRWQAISGSYRRE
jgi:hypothetical protein